MLTSLHPISTVPNHRVGKPKHDKYREILVEFAIYRARQRI